MADQHPGLATVEPHVIVTPPRQTTTPALDNDHQRDVLARLKRIEGQLRGIRKMIEEPRPCIAILQQLAAAEAAIGRVSHVIIKFHVEKCVPHSMAQGSDEHIESLAELVDIVDRFSR
jgi:CsoR family transcriptional regulator, copper-sensing transcriptional repressor